MHPPLLRPHPKCQEEVKTLMTCHEANPYSKFFGACNDAKHALDKCFAVRSPKTIIVEKRNTFGSIEIEKEEKRRENMMKARRFDDGYQRELELRRKEREEEEREQQAR